MEYFSSSKRSQRGKITILYCERKSYPFSKVTLCFAGLLSPLILFKRNLMTKGLQKDTSQENFERKHQKKIDNTYRPQWYQPIFALLQLMFSDLKKALVNESFLFPAEAADDSDRRGGDLTQPQRLVVAVELLVPHLNSRAILPSRSSIPFEYMKNMSHYNAEG